MLSENEEGNKWGKKTKDVERIRTIPAIPKAIVVRLYHLLSKTVHLLHLYKTLIAIHCVLCVSTQTAHLKDLRKWTVDAYDQLILFFWHYIPTSLPPPQWRQQRVLQRPQCLCSCVEIHHHLRLQNERARVK